LLPLILLELFLPRPVHFGRKSAIYTRVRHGLPQEAEAKLRPFSQAGIQRHQTAKPAFRWPLVTDRLETAGAGAVEALLAATVALEAKRGSWEVVRVAAAACLVDRATSKRRAATSQALGASASTRRAHSLTTPEVRAAAAGTLRRVCQRPSRQEVGAASRGAISVAILARPATDAHASRSPLARCPQRSVGPQDLPTSVASSEYPL